MKGLWQLDDRFRKQVQHRVLWGSLTLSMGTGCQLIRIRTPNISNEHNRDYVQNNALKASKR
jgi:hypothetical protein